MGDALAALGTNLRPTGETPPPPSLHATDARPNPTIAMVDKLYGFMPPDESGCLSGKSLRSVMSKSVPPLSNKILGGVWNMCDTDQAGKLNKPQLIRMFGLLAQAQAGMTPSLAKLHASSPPPTITGLEVDCIVENATAPEAAPEDPYGDPNQENQVVGGGYMVMEAVGPADDLGGPVDGEVPDIDLQDRDAADYFGMGNTEPEATDMGYMALEPEALRPAGEASSHAPPRPEPHHSSRAPEAASSQATPPRPPKAFGRSSAAQVYAAPSNDSVVTATAWMVNSCRSRLQAEAILVENGNRKGCYLVRKKDTTSLTAGSMRLAPGQSTPAISWALDYVTPGGQYSHQLILQHGPGTILNIGGEELGRCTSLKDLIAYLRHHTGYQLMETTFHAQSWYHGAITRQQAEHVLGRILVSGRYLVRKSTKEDLTYIISMVNRLKKIVHHKIHFDGETWFKNDAPAVTHHTMFSLLQQEIAPRGYKVRCWPTWRDFLLGLWLPP